MPNEPTQQIDPAAQPVCLWVCVTQGCAEFEVAKTSYDPGISNPECCGCYNVCEQRPLP